MDSLVPSALFGSSKYKSNRRSKSQRNLALKKSPIKICVIGKQNERGAVYSAEKKKNKSRGALMIVFLGDLDWSEQALEGEQEVALIEPVDITSEGEESLDALVSFGEEADHALGLERLLLGRQRRL